MAAQMVQDWGLGSAATWVGPLLLLIAAIAIVGAALGSLARWLRGRRERELEMELIGREMLDECFAKGEMLREDCEERCKGFGHPREARHPPPPVPADFAP